VETLEVPHIVSPTDVLIEVKAASLGKPIITVVLIEAAVIGEAN
jgi:hypothetical protein